MSAWGFRYTNEQSETNRAIPIRCCICAGKMTTEKLEQVLHLIDTHAEMIGLTIAEYLPFDEERLSRVFAGLRLFGD